MFLHFFFLSTEKEIRPVAKSWKVVRPREIRFGKTEGKMQICVHSANYSDSLALVYVHAWQAWIIKLLELYFNGGNYAIEVTPILLGIAQYGSKLVFFYYLFFCFFWGGRKVVRPDRLLQPWKQNQILMNDASFQATLRK